MPVDYARIDLRIPPEWSAELEQMQKELYEKSGLRASKASLIRNMMERFFKEASSSCIPDKKKT